MKNIRYLLILLNLYYGIINSYPFEPFNILLKPTWIDLEKNSLNVQLFGGKWILAGIVTFEKKAKDTIFLEGFDLAWQGTQIEHLNASLYRKDTNKKFLPIQQNLICDGTWHKTNQTLTLNFEKKHILGPINMFYLVLTVPSSLESILKQGSFSLVLQTLPEEFKLCAHKNNIKMTYSELNNQHQTPTLASLNPHDIR